MFLVTETCGWEDKALQECNLSAQSSMDGSACIRPDPGGFPGRVSSWASIPLQAMVPSVKLIVSFPRRSRG